MKFRAVISMILLCSMLVSLAACAGTTAVAETAKPDAVSPENTASVSAETAEESTDQPQVVFLTDEEETVPTETEAEEKTSEKDQIRQIAENCVSPLVINEAVVSQYGVGYTSENDNYDWVELFNRSGNIVLLSDYFLSDDPEYPYKYQLPEKELEPGELYLVVCDQEAHAGYDFTGFSLDTKKETLYLSTEEGTVDAAYLKNIPLLGSYGRMGNGNEYYYFALSTPLCENTDGKLFRSEQPECTGTPEGVYNDVESVTVSFAGKGALYYTTDGSMPSANSTQYAGPFELTETTIIRVVSIEEGGLASSALTQSYIINEGLTLPVVSLTADDPALFNKLYWSVNNKWQMPGNVTFLDGTEGFNIDCGMCVGGWGSLYGALKKNLNLFFRSAYGDSSLSYDFFDTGVHEYKTLSLRGGGQDYVYRLYTNELWQDMALAMDENALTQHSRFCILFLNGEYYGIYTIKETQASNGLLTGPG